MTTSTDAGKEIVVEAVDRGASARLSRFLGEPESFISDMLDGLLDHTDTIQEFARHRIAERERIVAWLRDDAAKTRADLTRLHAAHKLTAGQTAEWEALIALKAGLADAIERGDHITTGQEEGA